MPSLEQQAATISTTAPSPTSSRSQYTLERLESLWREVTIAADRADALVTRHLGHIDGNKMSPEEGVDKPEGIQNQIDRQLNEIFIQFERLSASLERLDLV